MASEYLSKGDHVLVRRVGSTEWTRAGVWLASSNHRSIALALHGMVRAGDGLVGGALPLSFDPETGVYEGVLTEDEYEVKKETEDAGSH
jgi:hypothetical protein